VVDSRWRLCPGRSIRAEVECRHGDRGGHLCPNQGGPLGPDGGRPLGMSPRHGHHDEQHEAYSDDDQDAHKGLRGHGGDSWVGIATVRMRPNTRARTRSPTPFSTMRAGRPGDSPSGRQVSTVGSPEVVRCARDPGVPSGVSRDERLVKQSFDTGEVMIDTWTSPAPGHHCSCCTDERSTGTCFDVLIPTLGPGQARPTTMMAATRQVPGITASRPDS